MNQWTKQYPEEEGYYWFYGNLWSNMSGEHESRLEHVKVRKIANGYAYVSCGAFVEPRYADGYWMRNNEPTPPSNTK